MSLQILHLVGPLDPSKGGPPNSVTRLASAQALLGHRVGLASPVIRGLSTADVQRMLDPVPGFRKLELFFFDPDFANVLGFPRKDPGFPATSVLHIHGCWEPYLVGGARWASKRQIPYCFAPHGMLDRWSMAQSRWKKRLALALGWRDALNRGSFIHVLNSDEAEGARPLRLKPPFEVIPNGVFLGEFSATGPAGAFRERYPKLGARPFVLFLSRLHHKKGLDLLAAAFARVAQEMPDVMLVVVGPDEGARADFEHRIADYGLADRTLLTGPLYGEDKIYAMRDASVFCLPSRQEGFSNALLEALQLGVPVAITKECHFPEVGEFGAGLITSLHPSEIADALITILRDKDGSMAMGKQGQQMVEDKFVWQEIARRAIAAYQRRCGIDLKLEI